MSTRKPKRVRDEDSLIGDLFVQITSDVRRIEHLYMQFYHFIEPLRALLAAHSFTSEREQERVNRFILHIDNEILDTTTHCGMKMTVDDDAGSVLFFLTWVFGELTTLRYLITRMHLFVKTIASRVPLKLGDATDMMIQISALAVEMRRHKQQLQHDHQAVIVHDRDAMFSEDIWVSDL
jgi:hypothetical protein